MPIIPTKCFEKIAGLKKPIRCIQGGSSAGKTYSILLWLIYYCLNDKRSVWVSIVAESIPVLKKGAEKDFFEILKANDWYYERHHNKTDRTYKIGNSTIEFFGADDASKLRGARRDILFINEANNVSFESYNQLSMRTKRFTFLDWNPTSVFWANDELIGQDNCDFLIVNYKDNDFLEQKIINDIESWKLKGETSEYWANYWKTYGLGELGVQSGAIYTDWNVIATLPKDAELVGSGMDFGYSNDPSALVSFYRYNGEIIIDEKIYQKGLLNSQLNNLIKSTDAQYQVIYADSAEPKTIAELRSYGLVVLPVVKGKDSISYGIQLIQENKFSVTARSVNLIKELQNYTWQKDKDGKSLNIPIDNFNHALDALRYFFLMKMGRNRRTFGLKWK